MNLGGTLKINEITTNRFIAFFICSFVAPFSVFSFVIFVACLDFASHLILQIHLVILILVKMLLGFA